MKAAPTAVISALANNRELTFADCFTITLPDSTVARYTNAQYNVVIPVSGDPSLVYVAGDILIDGLKLKQTCGIDIDQQELDISFKPTSTISGLTWPIAVREGRFDGATIERARAVLTAPGGAAIGNVAVVSFHGLVATVDNIGRLSCKMTVKSMLNKLAVDMPRDIWQPSCLNTLYDGLCTIVKAANGTSGTVGVGPSYTYIPWSSSTLDTYDQGTITFESGANVGVSRTVKQSTSSGLLLARPLDYLPSAGDNFVVYKGCDKTMTTCKNRFNNLANFRGFPFVPPPELSMY